MIDLQHDGRTEAPKRDYLLDGFQEVGRFEILNLKVSVTKDAEDCDIVDHHAGNKASRCAPSNSSRRMNIWRPLSDSTGTKRGRTFGTFSRASRAATLDIVQPHREIYAAIGYEWKRVAGIDCQRSADRKHFLLEVAGEVLALARGKLE